MNFPGVLIEAIRTALNVAKREDALSKDQILMVTQLLSDMMNPVTEPTAQIVIKHVRLSGAGVTEVSRDEKSSGLRATHLSIYIEKTGAQTQWLEDIEIALTNWSGTWTQAVVAAAKYSMGYQLPIKKFM